MSITVDASVQDPSRIVVQLLLNELRGAAFVWPLARDISSQVEDGSLTAIIPRSQGYSVGDSPGAVGNNVNPFLGTAPFVNVARAFNRDELVVDRFKSVHDYIYDLDQDRSRIDLRSNFLAEAPASMAEYLEADITKSLWLGKSSLKEVDGSGTGSFVEADFGANAFTNYIRFSGADGVTANALVEVSQLDDVAIRMSSFKIPKADRIFLCSPKQARKLAANSAIRDASQFGTNESVLNGEVARIAGFRIIESPFLAPNKAVAFHRDAIYRAILQNAAIESSRQHEILADLLTITVKYGLQITRAGAFVFPMAAESGAVTAAEAGILADQINLATLAPNIGLPGDTNVVDSDLGSNKS